MAVTTGTCAGPCFGQPTCGSQNSAFATMGGLLVATVLTLIFLPAL